MFRTFISEVQDFIKPIMDKCILIIVQIIIILILFRNRKVSEYRLKVINQCRHKDRKDIFSGIDTGWRVREFDKVSYIEMLLKFWKPVNSFFSKLDIDEN